MSEESKRKDVSNYVLLGSLVGSLIGTTVVLLTLAKSEGELKSEVKELQRELMQPIRVKFAEMVDHIGETFKKALTEASQKTSDK